MNQSAETFWLDRRVLVTGATGLLGSWLTDALVKEGASVVALIRDRVPESQLVRSGLINKINVVTGKIENFQLLERTINEYQVEIVFHLAAQTIVGIANENPLSTFESNIRGTWQLLEACRRSSWVKGVVTASSDKAYGANDELPYSEETALLGRHPYDVSKTCADLIAQGYAKSYNLPVCITRFGNLFGSGDLNYNRIIPGTIRSVLRNEAPIIRSDGLSSRDYIYVEDAAHAYMVLAQAMTENPEIPGEAFNFSYECPLSVREVVDKILVHMGRTDLVPKVLNAASNEIPHQYLNSRKAQQTLGWRPLLDFDEGLRRTIKSYTALLGRMDQ